MLHPFNYLSKCSTKFIHIVNLYYIHILKKEVLGCIKIQVGYETLFFAQALIHTFGSSVWYKCLYMCYNNCWSKCWFRYHFKYWTMYQYNSQLDLNYVIDSRFSSNTTFCWPHILLNFFLVQVSLQAFQISIQVRSIPMFNPSSIPNHITNYVQ